MTDAHRSQPSYGARLDPAWAMQTDRTDVPFCGAGEMVAEDAQGLVCVREPMTPGRGSVSGLARRFGRGGALTPEPPSAPNPQLAVDAVIGRRTGARIEDLPLNMRVWSCRCDAPGCPARTAAYESFEAAVAGAHLAGFVQDPNRPVDWYCASHAPHFVQRPSTLAGPVDDLAQQVADTAYYEIKAKFLQDKDELAQDVVDSATQPIKDMVQNILNDATTQAKLGEEHAKFKQDVRDGVMPAIIGGVVTTLVGTFLIVRYAR